MRCVLHIGTEKTGSTLLQDWLYANRGVLSRHGIALSDEMGQTNNRRLAAVFQTRLDEWALHNGVRTLAEKDAYFEGFLTRVAAEIAHARKTHHTCLISSEHLHSRLVTPAEIAPLRDFLTTHFDEIRVVCYFRNQFDLAVSLYSTALRVGETRTLDAFLDAVQPGDYYYDHGRSAALWAETFGAAACDFRIYDRALFRDGDIRSDLLERIDPDLPRADFDDSVASANPALSRIEAELYRCINILEPFVRPGDGLLNPRNAELKARVSRARHAGSGRIRSTRRREVEERFTTVNAAFFARVFDGTNRFLTSGVEEATGETISVEEAAALGSDLIGAVLEPSDRRLTEADGAVLRDCAIRIASGEALGPEEALALMTLAQRARPKGPVIRRWVQDLTAQLAKRGD